MSEAASPATTPAPAPGPATTSLPGEPASIPRATWLPRTGTAIGAFELTIVTLLALAMLLPGVWTYSLVDPWETHYGEVARRMLQDHDWVHTDWQNEGFRSKPVLTFWLMAASMRVLGLGADGGYSGEMSSGPMIILAIRLPFVLFGVLGLVSTWWMLARLISRRVAYLAFLVIATTPFYFFVARQGITDITLVGCLMGAMAMFAMAIEAGDEPIRPLGDFHLGSRRISIDGRHIFFVLVGGFVLLQAFYYLDYFARAPRLANIKLWKPGVLLFIFMNLGLLRLASAIPGLSRLGDQPIASIIRPLRIWRRLRTALGDVPDPLGGPTFGQALRVINGYYVVRALLWPFAALVTISARDGWRSAGTVADHIYAYRPIKTARQVYFLWFYALLGISVLGKGPAAVGILGVVCLFYVVLRNRWRELYEGAYEIKRGILLIIVIAVPWHVGMWLKEGRKFIQEYFITHLLNRVASGVHGERGTFDFFLSQVGYGMFIWAGLVPAAVAALVTRTHVDTREGRVRFLVATWAITCVAFFSAIQTKFHHYILPAVPALGILIAFWLDDVIAGRARRSMVLAALGAAIVLLVARDMMHEEKQWIEMFVYRYDRPWPSAEPWAIDTSDGFLGLGIAGALAVLMLGVPRLWRWAAVPLCGVALAAALWAMHVYMPIAGTHWGMHTAAQRYYQQRQIYGAELVYYGPRQLADDWAGVTDRWTIPTLVPDHVQLGQPMTIKIKVRDARNERTDLEVALVGHVVAIDDGALEVALVPEDLARLRPMITAGRNAPRVERPPARVVDADRLLAWQLYWRGENFWSGDEIWGPIDSMKTAFKETDNVRFLKYLGEHGIPGRTYFVLTEAGRIGNLRSILPTPRGKETFEVLDTTSNKFSLASFEL